MSRIASHRITGQGRATQGQARHFNCFKPARANRKSCRQLQQLQKWPKCWQLFCANARHGSQTQFSSYLAPTSYLPLSLSLFLFISLSSILFATFCVDALSTLSGSDVLLAAHAAYDEYRRATPNQLQMKWTIVHRR